MVHKTKKTSERFLVGILPMKEYQRQADNRHYKAVQEWHEGERQMYPPIAFYKFYTPHGTERKTGFVLSWRFKNAPERGGSKVFNTKKEAMEAWERGNI
jgi:hypothetical protein